MGNALRMLILAAVFAAAPPAWAQVITGTVTGTVSDAQGGVLRGATVVLVNETRGTRTNQFHGSPAMPNNRVSPWCARTSIS